MLTELLEILSIIDDLANVVSDIRSRQMYSSIDKTCGEVTPIKERIRALQQSENLRTKQLISSDEKDIISRYCNKHIQFK